MAGICLPTAFLSSEGDCREALTLQPSRCLPDFPEGSCENNAIKGVCFLKVLFHLKRDDCSTEGVRCVALGDPTARQARPQTRLRGLIREMW